MSTKVVLASTIFGLSGIAAVAAYFSYKPEKARELGNAALKGVENTVDKIIDGATEWVEETVMPAAREMLVSAGIINDGKAATRQPPEHYLH